MSGDALVHLRAVLDRYRTQTSDSIAATEVSHEMPGAATLRRGSPEHLRDLTYLLGALLDEIGRQERRRVELERQTADALTEHTASVLLDRQRYLGRLCLAACCLAGFSTAIALGLLAMVLTLALTARLERLCSSLPTSLSSSSPARARSCPTGPGCPRWPGCSSSA